MRRRVMRLLRRHRKLPLDKELVAVNEICILKNTVFHGWSVNCANLVTLVSERATTVL